MTNPTRKRVVTLDDLNVLNQNAAYARQKGEEASAAAQLADIARQNLEGLSGPTQAAGEQATQAAQAATLAKNSATAAALQASQAAGDAVTAAELAEGAAGSANRAAGAATTAAQRVTDAVLDLTGIKAATAQAEARANAAAENATAALARAAHTRRLINQARGYRTGQPTPAPQVSGTLGWIANDGTWPHSRAAAPQVMTLSSGGYIGIPVPNDTPDAVWPTGRRLTWGAWVRRATLGSGGVQPVLYAYNLSGGEIGGWNVAADAANLALGYTVTNGPLTLSVTAERGDDVFVQVTTALPAGTASARAYLRNVSSGTALFQMPVILLDADVIDPYSLYPESATDLDPAAGVQAVSDRVSALEAQAGGGAGTALNPAPTLIAIGDSITYGALAGGPEFAWPKKLCELMGWTLIKNAGVPGIRLVGGVATNWRETIGNDKPGHITLMLGTNDYNGMVALGAPGSTDGNTYYGALRNTAVGILDLLPQSVLYLMTPMWRTDIPENNRWAGYTMEQIRQAVRDVAAALRREYGDRAQLIDIGRDLRDYMLDGTNYMDPDNLHPNAAGHTLMGQYLSQHVYAPAGATATPAPAAPVALAVYDAVQGANAGLLYDRIGTQHLTITGATYNTRGLVFTGGAGQRAEGAFSIAAGQSFALTVAGTSNVGGGASILAETAAAADQNGNYYALGVQGAQYWLAMAQEQLAGAVPAGTPFVFTAAYDAPSTTATLYVNGAIISTLVQGAALPAQTRLYVGAHVMTNLGHNGEVHYLRVDGALTAAQAQAVYSSLKTTLAGRGVTLP